MITQARLKELLDYDPSTGLFRWRVNRRGGVKSGDIAGHHNRALGYILIIADRRLYYAHRLVWLYTHGSFPVDQIDHINSIKTDNRLENLREATPSQQNANKRGWRAGLKGCWPKRKKWAAAIGKNGRSFYLGSFNTEEAAHRAYTQAAKQIYGEFAKVA